MNLSAPFIHRPIATALLCAALFLAGVAAYTQLPVAPLPKLDFPTVSVSASLPGASPETMASSVATPLERRFGRIAGVTEITSSSSLSNTSVSIQFDLNRDIDAAARDVQAAINASLGELPSGMPFRPTYHKVNPSDAPILILALTSDAIPLGQVFDTANTVLAQRISQVPGVGQVQVGGGQQPAVRIQVDSVALAGMSLGMEDVRNAVANATVNSPEGAISGSGVMRPLSSNDQLFNAAAFAPIVIAQNNGSTVRLRDIARVFDDVENARLAAWFDHQRAVLLIIRRQPGANVIETIDRVKALLPSLAATISQAIRVEVAIDRAGTIRASVRDVERSLAISVVLVVLVVFAFLRSAWATMIPSVAVPLSLVGTFAVMYLLDYSLDNLSLMALTISTGFVVDDAIVVTENVARYIELGESGVAAALKGARQIGFTILSITVSLLAVFLPILLMGGMVGRLFREFAVTLSVAIGISAVLSLTLTPAMCSRLLRPGHGKPKGLVGRAAERFFDGMLFWYERGLRVVLRHPWLTLTVTVGVIVLNVYLVKVTPMGLFPQQDTGQLIGSSDAPQDISFTAMRDRQRALSEIVQSDPDVHHVVSSIGSAWSGGMNSGMVFVGLNDSPPRRISADGVINRLRGRTGSVPGIALYLQSVQDVRMGARSSRTQYQYTLQDADLTELRTWAPRLLEGMKRLHEIKDVNTDQQNAGLQLSVNIDRDTASRLGIVAADVDNALNDAFGQRQIATTYTQMNQYRVVLETLPTLAATPSALHEVYVRTPTGAQVPLDAIASAAPSLASLAVNHQGQFPATTLSFNLAHGVSLGQAVTAIHNVERRIGLPPGVHAEFQGTAQAFQSSLSSEPLLLIAALIAVYLVLGMLYESLIHPITILSTLPPASAGALIALRIVGDDFSIIALIGIVLLIGIVKKNAIMMIDFALEAERDEGLPPKEAIHKACVLRFRPIMMTTLAALLGGLPLALGSGPGSELRQPLGVTIVGGLLVSQMLTLYTTPVIYLFMDRVGRFFRRVWAMVTGYRTGGTRVGEGGASVE